MRQYDARWQVGYVLIILSLLGLARSVGAAPEEKALRMIVVKDQQTALEVQKQLQQGASFSALARAKSTGPEYRNWGYSGVVRLDSVQPVLRTALQKLKDGQVSEVLEIEKQYLLVKVLPSKLAQHLDAAERAQRAEQWQQAISELQAVIRLEEDNVQAHIRLGMLQQNVKQYGEAIRALEYAQKYAPQEAQVILLLATAYTHAAIDGKNVAQAEKAVQLYQRALQMEERLAPSIHFGLGKISLLVLRQPDNAVKHLEKAVEANSRVADVHRLLIQAYYELQNYDQARQRLRAAQDLGYSFPELQTALQKAK